jgi:hypothetical protein
VDDRQVSGEHASLRWTDAGWQVRDLGSRNGTFLGAERLESGRTSLLFRGARLRLGASPAWTLVHDGPPGPAAVRADGVACGAEGEMLVLPSPEAMRALVYQVGDGWVMELDGEPLDIRDGQAVRLGDEEWRVFLPISPPRPELPTTWDTSARPPLETLELRFRVSQDEEQIDLDVGYPGGVRTLTPRAHHLVTLTLARARIEDRRAGIAPPEAGWRYADELCRSLRLETSLLTLHLFRAREQLAQAGVEGAARLFERRRMSGQLRISLDRLSVSASR